MAKLIFTDPEHANLVHEFIEEKTTVGRAPHNTLAFPDPSLSAVHCEILVNGAEVIVRDLGSRNGTYVNGVKLQKQQAQLKDGQKVRFGEIEARLELDPPFPVDDTDIGSIAEMEKVRQQALSYNPAAQTREIPQPWEIRDKTATLKAAPAVTPAPQPAIPTVPEVETKSLATKIAIILFVLFALAIWFFFFRK